MLTTTVGRLRVTGMLEGVSFLLLLGVAMPLKYFADMPLAVKIVGWTHGLLFMVFCMFLLVVHGERRWSMRWTATIFVAALLPFGPFVILSKPRLLRRAQLNGVTKGSSRINLI